MKTISITLVAALFFAAVSAPAQVVDSRSGRTARQGVTNRAHAGDIHGQHPSHVAPRASSRGYSRGGSDGRYPAPAHGYWTTVCEQVLVAPGHWDEVRVPPTYGWVYDSCGRSYWGVVNAGGCQRVWHPARYESRTRRVWVNC